MFDKTRNQILFEDLTLSECISKKYKHNTCKIRGHTVTYCDTLVTKHLLKPGLG